MIRSFSVFLFIALAFSGFSQDPFKRGMYKSLDEIRYNSPSSPLEYPVLESTKRFGEAFDRKESTYYRLSIKNKKSREIGPIIGFSDGNTLYLATTEVSAGEGSMFSPADRLNDSIYVFEHYYYEFGFELLGNLMSGGSQIFLPSASKVQSFYVINLNGTINKLTVEYMTKLLSKNDELAYEFEKERSKEGLLLLYLMKLLDDGEN
ncbi:MAG: hypothetical protein ABJG47_03100 [Ekhidna sp.]